MYYCTVLSLYEDATLQERDKALQEVEQSKKKQDNMETAVEKLKKDLEISKREKEKLSSSLSDLESYRENMLAKVSEYSIVVTIVIGCAHCQLLNGQGYKTGF